MNKSIVFLLTLIFLLCRCTRSNPDNIEEPDNDDDYEYVLGELILAPGVCLPDVEDKYDGVAEKIPENRLKQMSTLGLIPSFFEEAERNFSVPYAFHSRLLLSSGTSRSTLLYTLALNSPCIQEFLNRDNAEEALTLYYKHVNFECFESYYLYEPEVSFEINHKEWLNFCGKVITLEHLFSTEEILKQLDSQKSKELVKLLLIKQAQWDNYPNIWLSGALSAIAWIMYNDQYPPVVDFFNKDEESFLNLHSGLAYLNAEEKNEIMAFVESYIKQ